MENTEQNEQLKDTPENVRILNEKLGITSRENLFNSAGINSINEMFESSKRDFELLCKDIAEQKEELTAAEAEAHESFDTFKEISNSGTEMSKVEAIENAALSVSNFSDTINSMKELIDRGNDIIGKLYDAIVHTDIIDPDLLNASASIIHSIRESNDNLIQYNMQKMSLEQQYRLAIETEKLKHKHALEKEYFKFKLRQQEIELKAKIKREDDADKNAVDVTISDNGASRAWSQSDMAELIRNSKNS